MSYSIKTKEFRKYTKICLIIHSLKIGGMEQVMALLAQNFSEKEKTEVHLILIGRNRKISYSLSDSIALHRPKFKFDNSKRIRHTLKTIKFLRSKVKQIQPEVVLSFGEIWNNLVLISLYGLNISVIISDRSTPAKYLGTFHNFLKDILYPAAAGYIAQTEKAKEVCLKNNWNNNVLVSGNPIRQIPKKNNKKENIILFVGRLIKTKQIGRLIKMFTDVRQTGWRLKIVGGDAKKKLLSKEYQKLIDELNANSYISLEGQQKNVEDYYNRSKIFAFPSSSEGFPNVIGEAQSAGLPVVAFDCIAGPSDIVKNEKNGFLVPLNDFKKFAECLKLLMKKPQLRKKMGERGRKDVQKFNSKAISDKIYTFLINNISE